MLILKVTSELSILTRSTFEEMCIESIERYRHKVSAEGGHTRHEIGVDSRMKWLSFVALLSAVFASGARAQWVAPQHASLKPGDFDRPHPAHHHLGGMRPLSVPPSIPNWPFPNIDVTNSPDSDQTEPSISINPLDPLNVVIAANDDRNFDRLWVYTSLDGGRTWKNQPLPFGPAWVDDAFDPSVAFNRYGAVYVMSGELNDISFANDIEVFRSTDKGITWQRWGTPMLDTLPDDSIGDKYYLAIDNSTNSIAPDAMYAAWVMKGFSDTAAKIAVSISSDKGRTWSRQSFATEAGIYTSPIPAVGQDGIPNMSFNDHAIGHPAIYGISQNDAPIKISDYAELGPVEPFDAFGNPTNDGYPCINGDAAGPLLVNSFPSIACDPISFHERTYVVWCGKGTDNVPHLWYAFSDGVPPAWSMPRAIEGDSIASAAARFFPWIATDPKTGNVAVVYYVAHREGSRLLADLYMAHSTDNGDTWATRRISDASSYSAEGRDARDDSLKFFGDYINLAGYNNTWRPAWTDDRASGDAEIYTATVQPFAPMPVTQLATHDTTVNGKPGAVLTWQYTPETTFGYPLPAGYEFDVAKDGSRVSLQPGDILQFVDTNIQKGNEYEVTVVSGSYRSITDSIPNAKSAVAVQTPDISSIRFSNEPAIAGREDQLFLNCSEACRVSITFFDELGREVGPAMSDDLVSTHHAIAFTPEEPGVQFFVMKEISSTSSKEITGKISVLR